VAQITAAERSVRSPAVLELSDATGAQPHASIVAPRMITSSSSAKLATGHCLRQPSARSIASPQVAVARIAA
jgi:hypothetical protein